MNLIPRKRIVPAFLSLTIRIHARVKATLGCGQVGAHPIENSFERSASNFSFLVT